MSGESTPILIGAGQYIQRDVDPREAKSPLEMMAECARRAAVDTGVGPEILARIDSVAVVHFFSYQCENPPALLAEKIGATPREHIYTTPGGNTPQWMVNRTAERICRGQLNLALLAGGEAFRTVGLAHRAGIPLNWESGRDGKSTRMGDPRVGTNEEEEKYGIHWPIQIYPLFENALRAARGLGIEEHRRMLGELCARFSRVAVENPVAWFHHERSAEEISTVTRQNRIVSFPYTKLMNPIIDVDQAAAVLMTSVGTARRLGVPPSQWVYLWGVADTEDHWFVSERVNYHTSPAIRAAGNHAMEMADIDIDDIEYLDLYSCFPCAVQIGREMLGIPPDDPRLLTVTGGLASHGGPGSNYSMHAVATMLEKVRAEPGTAGLVSSLGWYLTKHSMAVYSAVPQDPPWRPCREKSAEVKVDCPPPPKLEREPRGKGVIETYTVLHDREGKPERGIVIGRLEDGSRFLANTPPDRTVLESLETAEGVGRPGTVFPTKGGNVFDPS